MSSKLPALLGASLFGAALAAPFPGFTAEGMAGSPVYSMGNAAQLHLPVARSASAKISTALQGARGRVNVIVQLTGAPLAVANGVDSKHLGSRLSRGDQMAFTREIQAHQDSLLQKIMAMGGTEVGRVRIAYNAVIVQVDAAKLDVLAQSPEVMTIRPVGQYKVADDSTNAYIGATKLQAAGLDGSGVRVAMLDSGIDYTHFNLGGPGTTAAYQAARQDPTAAPPANLFPTSKVVGGYDFVGDTWPDADNDPEAPDPNPIDIQGHGTHTADILGGRSKDGAHVGVAPGVQLYAVKVCSSVSTACSGVAVLEGIDFALDPNHTGTMEDAVDIINMSLGNAYGEIQDDISLAAANAVRAGVIVVASAGNDGDKPYVTSSPGSAPEVISVAETQVPTAEDIPLIVTAPASIAGSYSDTAPIDWAPIGKGATGQVVYVGRACLTQTQTGSPDPLLADPAGKIALVDRGTCNVSEKIARLSSAGALGVIVGLVDAEHAVTFLNGGDCPVPPNGTCKPSLVVTRATANTLKGPLASGVPVTASISESNAVPLIGGVALTSSRGPDVSFNRIKPDIAAPGASVSATVGTGNGEGAFGGTSGAAPMVAGSAALLLQAYPNRSPAEIKSILMNTADTQIFTDPASLPGVLAPITRVGGGEVRVDQAAASQTAAWDDERHTGSLSFGYHAVDNLDVECRDVRVRNYSRSPRLYRISSTFRYADDAASHAVAFRLPPVVFVGPRSSASFPACITIDARRLPIWALNGGGDGGNGPLLQTAEYDGYLSIADGTDTVHLAWQVLPHRSATVLPERTNLAIPPKKTSASVGLNNFSPSRDGRVEVFALTGTSRKLPRSEQAGPGSEKAVIDLAAVGARLADAGDGSFALQFGINTFGARSFAGYPAGFQVNIDTDFDGKPDWFVFTQEIGGVLGADGRIAVFIQQAGATTSTAYYYADADLDSGNMIMTVPLGALGLSPTSKFRFDVLAVDDYFTGNVTDEIDGMVFTPGLPKFFGSGIPATGVPARQQSVLTVSSVEGGEQASPSQTGLLLLYRDAAPGREADSIQVQAH
jgi:minor extracellular serine protease Vpr